MYMCTTGASSYSYIKL